MINHFIFIYFKKMINFNLRKNFNNNIFNTKKRIKVVILEMNKYF